MKNKSVEGATAKALKVFSDERGRFMEILRSDEAIFEGFGQASLTTAHRGVVKAWHRHEKQVKHFCCVRGKIKLVLFDGRAGSPTRGAIEEFFLGTAEPRVVRVPAQVWYGFQGNDASESLVVTFSTQPHDHDRPDEERLSPGDPSIPYDWHEA